MPFIVFAFILAAVIGGGTSFAARNALPGDALWDFKININETIESAVAPKGKVQAYFDIAAIEDRLREAAKLDAEGRLSAYAQTQLETNLNAHLKSIQEQVAILDAGGNYSIAADVAARLQATLSKQGSEVLDIREALDTASNLSADASAKAAAY